MSEALEKAARATREEIVRQYRDDERRKCPGGAHFYEEEVAPSLIARAAITAFLSEVGLEGIRAAILAEPTINAGLQAQEVYKALMAHVADKDV